MLWLLVVFIVMSLLTNTGGFAFYLWAAFCSDPEVVEFTGCSHFSPESETLYHPVQITDVSGFQVQYSV